MKQLTRIAIALLLWVTCTMADVSGKWVGTMSDGQSSDSFLLVLLQDGTKVTGTAGPNESERHPMEKISFQDNKLTFEVKTPFGALVFDLSLKGDEITGTLAAQTDGQTVRKGTVSLKRQ